MSRERPSSVAVCRCGAPLVSTMVFPKKEWVCVECAATYGMFDANSKTTTDELWERYEALRALWVEHAVPRLRVGRWWLRDCEKCSPRAEYHEAHATDEERAAHQAALAWLADRAKAAAA